jgi:hypothetical protein
VAVLGQYLKSEQKFGRWNVNPTWHHFCSMYQEAALSKEALTEFARYHHMRGCFYFAIGAIESFLNESIRIFLGKKEEAEAVIFKNIRHTPLRAKIREWPSELSLNQHKIPEDIITELVAVCDLRDEISHPKHSSHAIYKELDEANADYLTNLVASYVASVHEGMQAPFPYWILGWNYVGLNRDMRHAMLSNNLNGFVYSLIAMKFRLFGNPLGGSLEGWEKHFMTSLDGYKQLKAGLDRYSSNIEPTWENLPDKPRLTNSWWRTA